MKAQHKQQNDSLIEQADYKFMRGEEERELMG